MTQPSFIHIIAYLTHIIKILNRFLAILYPNVFQFEITEISPDDFLKIFMDVSEKIESEESKGT